MTKFDYKKWVVENKYGKAPSYSHYGSLNEQEGTITYHGCSVCPEGSLNDLAGSGLNTQDIGGRMACNPVVSFNVPTSDIQNNDTYSTDAMALHVPNEYIGSNTEILQYGEPGGMVLWQEDSNWDFMCSGSGDTGGEDTGGEDNTENPPLTYFGCGDCGDGTTTCLPYVEYEVAEQLFIDSNWNDYGESNISCEGPDWNPGTNSICTELGYNGPSLWSSYQQANYWCDGEITDDGEITVEPTGSEGQPGPIGPGQKPTGLGFEKEPDSKKVLGKDKRQKARRKDLEDPFINEIKYVIRKTIQDIRKKNK